MGGGSVPILGKKVARPPSGSRHKAGMVAARWSAAALSTRPKEFWDYGARACAASGKKKPCMPCRDFSPAHPLTMLHARTTPSGTQRRCKCSGVTRMITVRKEQLRNRRRKLQPSARHSRLAAARLHRAIICPASLVPLPAAARFVGKPRERERGGAPRPPPLPTPRAAAENTKEHFFPSAGLF